MTVGSHEERLSSRGERPPGTRSLRHRLDVDEPACEIALELGVAFFAVTKATPFVSKRCERGRCFAVAPTVGHVLLHLRGCRGEPDEDGHRVLEEGDVLGFEGHEVLGEPLEHVEDLVKLRIGP